MPSVIAALTALAFASSLANGFVPWDDDVNLLQNPHYRGLGLAQLRWMLTATVLDHWIPVTWLTFGLDYTLWGMRPSGYHMTNVILHALGAVLLYLVALRLLRAASPTSSERALRSGAVVAALVFGVHPLRAESVAWVTQRRDVLSGALFLLTVLWYLMAVASAGRRRTGCLTVSAIAYALALASKSTVVTLPFVLLVLDVYPLGRLSLSPAALKTGASATVLREKLLYLALAITGGLLELRAGHTSLTSLDALSLGERLSIVAYSFAFYVWKTIVPVALSPLYELPQRVSLTDPRFAISALAVATATAAVIVLRRRWPAGLAASVTYGILLIPVSGIVHNGFQLVSDRYSYLSCLPWAMLAGAGVSAVVSARERGRVGREPARAFAVIVVLALGLLATLASRQSTVWRDGLTLWHRAIDVDPACSICHANLGVALFNERQLSASIVEFRQALTLRPGRDFVHAYLGVALLSAPDGSVPNVDVRPAGSDQRDPAASNRHLGEAVEHLEAALHRYPGDPLLLTHLGIAFARLGRPGEARPYLERAVLANPRAPLAHLWLARVYVAVGEPAKAGVELATVRTLDPNLARQLDAQSGR